jgi:CHAT domain-containing protein
VHPSANDQLVSQVWVRLAPHLDGVKTLFVASDGFFERLPLGTLRLYDGRFVLELMRVVEVGDALALTGLLQDPSPRCEAPALLALGGVAYGATDEAPAAARTVERRSWRALPWTAREAQQVLALHEGCFGTRCRRSQLGGHDATEAMLAMEVPGLAVLHLATHGYFDARWSPSKAMPAKDSSATSAASGPPDAATPPQAPLPPTLLTGLVLSGANAAPLEAQGDGYLSAEEILSLDLARCELVVLSACDTGVGTTCGGQGTQSVRNAFHEAGARTVISSLWKVPDEATSELMVELYRRMWQDNQPPGEALRGAQLWMLKKNRDKDGDPRPETWGAFVLSGDWR